MWLWTDVLLISIGLTAAAASAEITMQLGPQVGVTLGRPSANAAGQRVAELPAPTGPYGVGTLLYDWRDDTREEQWSSDSGRGRELMVQVWYPAVHSEGRETEPYVPNFERLKPSLNQDWPGMPQFKTHAIFDAPLNPDRRLYPVLIFSHGMNSARFYYTSLLEELASQGYVVAAIDHTYWGPGVTFNDGRTVRYEDGMEELDAQGKLTSDEYDQLMWAGVLVMIADEVYVQRQVARLNADQTASNPFHNRLDLARVGAVGHSMGGRAATQACLEYVAFNACASLDGLNPTFYLRPKPCPKPFLLLLNSTWGTSNISPSLAKRYLSAWTTPKVFVVAGTKHNSFDDTPLLHPLVRARAPSDPVRAHSVIAAAVVEFFNEAFGYVIGTPRTKSGLMQVDLRQIADKDSGSGTKTPK